jgi:ABC-type branched-subunit amino acid transport system substrate-binding protein
MALRPLLAGAAVLVLSGLAGCSTTFTPRACVTDDDCGGGGLVCDEVNGAPACLAATDATLHIGMSAPLSGPSQELGVEMQRGVSLAFDAQNASGGIRGRQLALDVLDDQYDPALAEQNTRALLDVQPATGKVRCPTTNTSAVAGQAPVSMTPLDRGPDAVLALLGNVGTPTMVLSAPIALETGTLFFGAFTGASLILRDTLAGPCHKDVFNVRASYADEAYAALEYFFYESVPDAAHLVSFDQDDSFGESGYDGLVAAYQAQKGGFVPPPADPTTPITRFRYTRDDETSVPAAVSGATAYLASLLAADDGDQTVGVFMTDTYGPATGFITGLRDWQYADDAQQASLDKATRLTLSFINVSFVGPNTLAAQLEAAGTVVTPAGRVPYTTGVLVSQVVPNYQTDESDVVTDYQALVQAAAYAPTFTSLEGYIDARVFIVGLLAHQGPFTPGGLIPTFETTGIPDLGFGPGAGFSAGDHDYSRSVWGTSIEAGATFQDQYFWTEGGSLQLFE